jgi:hypothetical protein
MRASEESDTELRFRSSWLMNPLVRPVAAASWAMVSPRSRRTARSRSPTSALVTFVVGRKTAYYREV